MAAPWPFASDGSKRELLRELGVLHALEGPADSWTLDALLVSARVHCLSKIELYFLQEALQLRSPLNLRNEAAAVSLLLAHLGAEDGGATASLRAALLDHGRRLWPELASGDLALSAGAAGDAAGGATESAAADSQQQQQQQGAGQPPRGVPAPPGSAAADFEAWAREQGVGAAINIASFGALRGCATVRDVAAGEALLSIPDAVLIYEDTVRQTDLGRMLMAIPGLTIDNLLVLFTMIDRHDEDSKWARYWRSLPDKYYTGLSFPEELVAGLEGTAAHLELQRAQDHLRRQYADTRPLFDILLQAYPAFLRPQWFDYESYLWAAELWYSYAFEVEFPPEEGQDAGSAGSTAAPAAAASSGASRPAGAAAAKGGKGVRVGKAARAAKPGAKPAGKASGSSKKKPSGGGSGGGGSSSAGNGNSSSSASTSKPVMVPFACHVNHSPWPHCVRYGKLNPATRTLDYPAFRPCPEGQQVYISYGPVPNMKLLCYYGFVVPANPHDLVPLLLEPPAGPLRARQLAALERLELGLEHSLQDGPLSQQLLACLRVIVATAAELADVKAGRADPRAGALNGPNEDQALRTLRVAVQDMLAAVRQAPLLADDGTAGSAAGGSSETAVEVPAAAGAAAGEEQAERQLGELHLQQPAAMASPQQDAAVGEQQGQQQQQQQQQPPGEQQQQQGQPANENGFDADWHMSRHFCRVYLRGQRTILERSMAECERLLGHLGEVEA